MTEEEKVKCPECGGDSVKNDHDPKGLYFCVDCYNEFDPTAEPEEKAPEIKAVDEESPIETEEATPQVDVIITDKPKAEVKPIPYTECPSYDERQKWCKERGIWCVKGVWEICKAHGVVMEVKET